MGRVPRVEAGGMVYHGLNRANFRSALFKKEAHYQALEKVPDTFLLTLGHYQILLRLDGIRGMMFPESRFYGRDGYGFFTARRPSRTSRG
jgi:hypothetical protein